MYDFGVKRVKTRKPHWCFTCYKDYPAGTMIDVETSIYDGRFQHIYICDDCKEYMYNNDVTDGDGMYPPGAVIEHREDPRR